MAASDKQRMSREDRAAAHVLPRWIQWVQHNLFLTFLILAEAYLLGDLMQRGWVANIERWQDWGVYHGIGVLLFFAAGACAAGIALACSVKAAACFADGRIFSGLFNLFGLSLFAGSEIWASLSERSANLAPTPADKAVLDILHVGTLPISPTVVVVALLLPIATIYYGFSQHKPEVETTEEIQARQQRELLAAQHKAQIRQVKAAGLASAARAATQAAFGSKDQSLPDESGQASSDNPTGDDDGSAAVIGGKEGRVSGGKDRAPGRAGSGRGNLTVMPKNLLTADDLRQYLARETHTIISEQDALAFIKAQPSAERVIGIQGQPWAANKAATLQRARAKFASGNTAQDEAL